MTATWTIRNFFVICFFKENKGKDKKYELLFSFMYHTWNYFYLFFAATVCSKEDYKLWSLSDALLEAKGIRGCLLGRKDITERRVPHAKCYNGEDYIRPFTVKNCSCTREDFEWFVLLIYITTSSLRNRFTSPFPVF